MDSKPPCHRGRSRKTHHHGRQNLPLLHLVMRRHPSGHTTSHDAHPAHKEACLPPRLSDAVLLGHLAAVAHACAPAVGRQGKQTPDVDGGQRQVIEEHARDDPFERGAFQAVRVAEKIVQSAGYDTHEQIGDEDNDESLASEKVPHSGNEGDDGAKLALAHAIEE